MLKKLELKCFRKHEDLSIDFSNGLNVLRGANEAGKSTILEAILYALYGSRALRNSLDKVVTWGHKDNELSVSLEVSVNGTPYTFKRSKAGATVFSTERPDGVHAAGGVLVTGQTEVSNYATQILGADAKTASLLMMASQSGLRGALDEGPAAVSTLMSKLADFDMIDKLVENAQAKLLLGSVTPFATKLQAAEEELALAKDQVLDASAADRVKTVIEDAQARVALIDETINDALMPKATAAKLVREQAEAVNARRAAQEQAITKGKVKVELGQLQLAQAQAQAADDVSDDDLDAARVLVADTGRAAELLQAYKLVTGLPTFPDVHWGDTGKEGFEAELDRLRIAHGKADADHAASVSAAKVAARHRITSGKCPTCGQATASDDHVAQHNATVDAEIADHNAAAAASLKAKDEIAADILALEAVAVAAKPFLVVSRTLANRALPVTVDTTTFPPRVNWVGPIPGDADADAARRALAALETKRREAMNAAGRAQALKDSLAAAQAELDAAVAGLAEMPAPVELEPLQAIERETMEVLTGAYNELATGKAMLRENQTRLADIERDVLASQRRVVSAERRLEDVKADIEALEFNNNLVKKLKGLKPAITDHLWNNILAAVGNFFSQLRGEQSVVTKDSTGFKVNGKDMDSFSGSTLDVLALSIRVALTKTFIPHASFIVLDEPAAGCDTSRTGNLLGFLSSVGFTQTLLASHDELSEAVADNVITVGT